MPEESHGAMQKPRIGRRLAGRSYRRDERRPAHVELAKGGPQGPSRFCPSTARITWKKRRTGSRGRRRSRRPIRGCPPVPSSRPATTRSRTSRGRLHGQAGPRLHVSNPGAQGPGHEPQGSQGSLDPDPDRVAGGRRPRHLLQPWRGGLAGVRQAVRQSRTWEGGRGRRSGVGTAVTRQPRGHLGVHRASEGRGLGPPCLRTSSAL